MTPLFIKGFTYGYDGRRGMYRTPEAEISMERMAALGCDWTALAFAVVQDSFSSTVIRPDYRWTVTDRDIIGAVERLHALGLKVCMKPMVNCADGVWRANIRFPEREWGDRDYWKDWFSSYTAFLCHYAEIAEETGCEMFCVGCEMVGTEDRVEEWRRTVEAVCAVYHGPLVYNTNHGKEAGVKWWDAMDFIGTSAYFRVAQEPGASVEAMQAAWGRHKQALADVSAAHGGKQVIFMEIGCRSARGCAMMPYDFSHREFPYDEDEQANFYESCFRSMWEEPWFAGFFWWDWGTFLPTRKPNMGFTIADKKAEAVVREWYARTHA
ncbi:MAG: glycosyl hydrolase family 53 [Clostridia bacterium]|nr:glycosyl hydrolase family 53 [Clostridia bacterium]